MSLVSLKNSIFILKKGASRASSEPDQGQLVRAGSAARAAGCFLLVCCHRPACLQAQPYSSQRRRRAGGARSAQKRGASGESPFFCLLDSCFACSSRALYLLHCCGSHYLWNHRFRVLTKVTIEAIDFEQVWIKWCAMKSRRL